MATLGTDIVGTALAYGLYDLSGGPSQRLDAARARRVQRRPAARVPRADASSSGGSRRSRRCTPTSAALPPALFSVGTADALLDDTLFMYERWTAAGNDARLDVYPESLHGFDTFPTAMAAEARRRIDAFIVARRRRRPTRRRRVEADA